MSIKLYFTSFSLSSLKPLIDPPARTSINDSVADDLTDEETAKKGGREAIEIQMTEIGVIATEKAHRVHRGAKRKERTLFY